LFTATENALFQDGAAADIILAAFRILKYDLSAGKPVAEFLYVTEPVAAVPIPATDLKLWIS
jgi:hypothetical protein